ncbi:MAG: ATP-binding protein, partial [Methanobacteriaceae archaeon]|nr:ATP-binding protein [Methanobacteriaceae archaeon]
LIIEELIKRGINKENILLIDLELPKFNNIHSSDMLDKIVLDFLDKCDGKAYLFFDEIQNVNNWEISINSYYKLSNVDIYITGSNSRLLSKELATLLTGRYVSIEMYPFSFNEFLYYKHELNEDPLVRNELNSEIEDYFDEYLTYGGFPGIIPLNSGKEIILNDLYDSIILNDIVNRYSLRNVGLFKRIIKFIIENIGNLISANSIYNYLKHDLNITKATIYNYLNYLEEAYIISKATREDLIGKKEIIGSEKYYLIDHGFYKSQLEDKQRNIGRLLENIVYVELLRHDFKITVAKVDNLEVDFIAKKNGKRIYIQVAYILSDETTLNREFKPLLEIKDNYPKYVLSMDKLDYSRDGIKHMNIINFLREFNL